MPDEKPLRPATKDETIDTLSFALRFNGKKRTHSADEFMATLMAKHLAEHLELAGYVIMKKPPAGPHDNPGLWYPEKPK